MTGAFERLDLLHQLLLGEGLTHSLPAVGPEAAIGATVRTVVADVERREKNDPIAVDLTFKQRGSLLDPFAVGSRGTEQRGHLRQVEPLALHGAGNHLVDLSRRGVRMVCQQGFDLLFVDKRLTDSVFDSILLRFENHGCNEKAEAQTPSASQIYTIFVLVNISVFARFWVEISRIVPSPEAAAPFRKRGREVNAVENQTLETTRRNAGYRYLCILIRSESSTRGGTPPLLPSCSAPGAQPAP